MTGFARTAGTVAGRSWSWELRSVNSRGLDTRLKLPAGTEAQETLLRQMTTAALTRGAVQAQLVLAADPAGTSSVAVRTEVLDRLLVIAQNLAARIPGAPPVRAEALLALPGVFRSNAEPDLTFSVSDLATIVAGYSAALDGLCAARRAEGARLAPILLAQIGEIAALTAQARVEAEHQHLAQHRRLQDSLRDLLGDTAAPISPDRMAQELALLASRADVREELDRLYSHVDHAHALIEDGAAVGRKLDFLVQEFNREANTLCAKSATAALTTTGMQLKAVIEQLREQVQNIE